MAQFNCSGCDSQDLEWKEGVSKTTHKPWKAWFCKTCKIMHGMDGRPWGDKGFAPKVATGASYAPKTAPVDHGSDANITRALEAINKKLDLILEAVGGKDEAPF